MQDLGRVQCFEGIATEPDDKVSNHFHNITGFIRLSIYYGFPNHFTAFHSFLQDKDNLIILYNIKTSEFGIKTKDSANVWSESSFEEVSDADIWKEWVCLRTKFTLKYNIDSSRSSKEQLQQFLEDTKTKLCDTNKPVIGVNDTEIVLKKNKNFVGIGKNTKVNGVLKQAKTDGQADGQKSDPSQFEVLHFTISPDDDNVEDISSMFGSK